MQPDRRQDRQRRHERNHVAGGSIRNNHQNPKAGGRPAERGHRQPCLRLAESLAQGRDRNHARRAERDQRQEQDAEDVVALARQVGRDRVEQIARRQIPLIDRPDLGVDRHGRLVRQPDGDCPDEPGDRDHRGRSDDPPPHGSVAPAPNQADGEQDPDHGEEGTRLGPDRDGVAQPGQDATAQGETALSRQHESAECQPEDDQVLEEGQPAVEEDQAGGAERQAGECRADSADRAAKAPDQRRRRQRDTQDHRQARLDDSHADELEGQSLEQAERQIDEVEVPLVRAPDPELDEVARVDDVECLVGERGDAVGDLRDRVGGGEGGQDRDEADAHQGGLGRNATERPEPAERGRSMHPAADRAAIVGRGCL